ncbi:MAG: alpha/beta fold hydrolase [Armatimonadetes bacterium]|nr:alpha/beta fold hydrolase [Armatimonadota bacterium]
MTSQRPVSFESGQTRLFGLLQEPEQDGNRREQEVGVVFSHGWSGYRVGPHQMFVHAARSFALEGFPSLRFDFRGRGDSEGALEEANLITMVEDMRAAVECLLSNTQVRQVILLGICSGAEVAYGAAACHPAVAGLALWSAPVFWAEAATRQEVNVAQIEARKKAHYLKDYARKLFSPTTWKKLIAGKLQFGLIGRVLLGRRKSSLEVRSVLSPQEFREQTISKFSSFKGRVLGVYGTSDPTTPEALKWYEEACLRNSVPFEHHLVEGANHSYYSLTWERQVIDRTLAWLHERATCEFST